MAYNGHAPPWLVNPERRDVFFNILRRQRDEDIVNQNRAIIAAIIAANVVPAALPPVPVPVPAALPPVPVPAAPVPVPANNAQQDSNDPNIGCIGIENDPNIGCVSIE